MEIFDRSCITQAQITLPLRAKIISWQYRDACFIQQASGYFPRGQAQLLDVGESIEGALWHLAMDARQGVQPGDQGIAAALVLFNNSQYEFLRTV